MLGAETPLNIRKWIIVAAALAVPACKQHTSSYSRPADDPHDTDSLYVLYRRILTDSDPVPTWAQVGCSMARLTERLGLDESLRRFRALRDTVYTPAENRRWRDIDPKLANHGYGLDDETCGPGLESHYQPDSLSDTSHRPRVTLR